MKNLNTGSPTGQSGFSPPSVSQLRDVIGRLVATIEEENHILEERRDLSLDPIIYKKSQLLLELMRAQKSCSLEFIKSNLEKDIRQFKSVMDANQQLLSVHLAAARDVSNTILDVLRQNDSDGTYAGSARMGRGIQ
jgi:flagellar biosynthesis/type III secretory pathway chaperone